MTFNDNANLGGGGGDRVRKRGRGVAIGGGIGGVGLIAVFLISQLFGVDLSGLVGGGTGGGGEVAGESLENCQTGADANASAECRVKGAAASLDDYWEDEVPALGGQYAPPQEVTLFTDATQTGCGSATSATGPFYCPSDEHIYVDVSFFDQLRSQFGSSGGSLAQMYVIAHEWGHHVQNLLGDLDRYSDGQTGPESNQVRIELQADCYAGAWVAAASKTKDEQGTTLLKQPTDAQIADALSAAAAVGDDRIQEKVQGQVTPHTFTHGTSEQRQSWFTNGYRGGAEACDTFSTRSL
ncbi:hypothetical protein SAMN04489806_1630 [Paramicrobacterium humi]|uniref:Neutral zinc metallopeptidase n=1 Tax=Paramicrobacterium humi TaxID=640635 RepID=A0A1H4LQY7_9MICO|nr:neutral zinc metallopeptidase [Microbacterium humi]SEB73150.1 hypothetical protein SAMN04489806_1630 [Microbacterium humi]